MEKIEDSLFYSRFSSDILLWVAICHPCVRSQERERERGHHRVAPGFVRVCLPLSRIPGHCPSPSTAVYKVSSTFLIRPHSPFLHHLMRTHTEYRLWVVQSQKSCVQNARASAAAPPMPMLPSDLLTRIGGIPRAEGMPQEQASEYITNCIYVIYN